VANTDEISSSLFKRYRKKLLKWLQNNRLPVAVQVLVGVFLFVGGVAFESLLDRGLTNAFEGTQGKRWLILLLLTVAAIVLTIVASVLILSLRAILEKLDIEHRTTREKVNDSYEAIMKNVESRFGITAEYISDKKQDSSGLTYKATQRLIEQAKERLLFVDWWVESSEYGDSPERKEYYRAITERIRNHRKENSIDRRGFFHERIIQMPKGATLDVLGDDEVYSEHIKDCLTLEAEVSRSVTAVHRASPFTHVHFAIIDDRYLVQPILTTDQDGLRRHGAVIFADPTGELIKVYEEMIKHLELDRLSTADLPSISPGSQAAHKRLIRSYLINVEV
jgi:hypothetical protein